MVKLLKAGDKVLCLRGDPNPNRYGKSGDIYVVSRDQFNCYDVWLLINSNESHCTASRFELIQEDKPVSKSDTLIPGRKYERIGKQGVLTFVGFMSGGWAVFEGDNKNLYTYGTDSWVEVKEPETGYVYVNIWQDSSGKIYPCSGIAKTLEIAKEQASWVDRAKLVGRAKIQWTEGQFDD